MAILWFLLLALALIVLAIVFALVFERSEKNMLFSGLETVLFLVMMPKNELKKDDSRAQEEKILISQMEQVLTNFLNLRKPKIFQDSLSVTLEIASQIGGEDISFYVAVPKYLETVFEKYVQGVYSGAIVQKVPEDYTVFEPQGQTAGAYLILKENSIFPISTYQKLEKDPLSTITNNLSKISANEGAAIQLIIRPLAGEDFRKKGEKVLSKIREGKSPKNAVFEVMQNPAVKFMLDFVKDIFKKEIAPDLQKKEQGFDQAGYDAVQSKVQKQAFQTNIRLVASAPSRERAEDILSHLVDSFSQFSLSSINSF